MVVVVVDDFNTCYCTYADCSDRITYRDLVGFYIPDHKGSILLAEWMKK